MRTLSGPSHWHDTAMRARTRTIFLARRWDESRDGAGTLGRPQPLPIPSPAEAGESTRGRTQGGHPCPSEAKQNKEHWNTAQRKRCGAAPSGCPRNLGGVPGTLAHARPAKHPTCTENGPRGERCLECAVSARRRVACALKPQDFGFAQVQRAHHKVSRCRAPRSHTVLIKPPPPWHRLPPTLWHHTKPQKGKLRCPGEGGVGAKPRATMEPTHGRRAKGGAAAM